ncbi:MAG: hypothetical protein WDZ31_04670 [Phycisphaeraceae bacterium]
MTDLLTQGAQWLNTQRRTHLSHTVMYERGAASAEVLATAGQTVFRFDNGYGATVRYVSRDFLITTADLVIDGAPVTPQRGDRIRETVSGITYIHEVMGPGNNEPDWKYSDRDRVTFRIHTKQVGQETAP